MDIVAPKVVRTAVNMAYRSPLSFRCDVNLNDYDALVIPGGQAPDECVFIEISGVGHRCKQKRKCRYCMPWTSNAH